MNIYSQEREYGFSMYNVMKMLYMTVYAVRQGSCVNNFAIETAEINSEVKHLHYKYSITPVYQQGE